MAQSSTNQVQDFIDRIADETMRSDSRALLKIMQEETGETPYMYGPSIVGFGTHHYKYESGREGDTVVVGFSPRKQALTLYGVIFYDQGAGRLAKLGKHTTGKGCLYIKKLADVDEATLREMIHAAYTTKSKEQS